VGAGEFRRLVGPEQVGAAADPTIRDPSVNTPSGQLPSDSTNFR
jgi:hypothetical protein